METTEICKICNGTGKDPHLPIPLNCSNCTGSGVFKKSTTKTDTLEKDKPKSKHEYTLKTYNGRVKIYCDGYVMFAFNQIDFSGYYAYKDDTNLYGIDIYMNRQGAGHQIMEIYFKTKENWLEVLKILDTM